VITERAQARRCSRNAHLPRPGAHAWPTGRRLISKLRERPARRRSIVACKGPSSTRSIGPTEPCAKSAICAGHGFAAATPPADASCGRLVARRHWVWPRDPWPAHPLVAENEGLGDTVSRFEVPLDRAQVVIAVQGNVSALLREYSLGSADSTHHT
jgi:hypothetical protein